MNPRGILDAISLRRAISDEVAAAEREDRKPSVANITIRISAVWGVLAIATLPTLVMFAIAALVLVRGVR